jgi:hypothetical protein
LGTGHFSRDQDGMTSPRYTYSHSVLICQALRITTLAVAAFASFRLLDDPTRSPLNEARSWILKQAIVTTAKDIGARHACAGMECGLKVERLLLQSRCAIPVALRGVGC